MAPRIPPARKALMLRLAALELLEGRAPRGPAPRVREDDLRGELLVACHQRRLSGGLSVALDLRPEELFGPLTHALGATATRLRLLDVRGDRPVQLHVQLGTLSERWEVEDCAGLVHNVNDLFKDDGGVKVAAVLGEWEDMLQLWCVPKDALPELLSEPYFLPRNLAQLEAIACN